MTDGVILLRPLTAGGAADHLAGEDEQMAKWLSGGRSTLANAQGYIASSLENWRNNGPRRAFGIFECATNRLIGSVEANLALLPEPGQVNVSFGVFREWRGRGVACRALALMAGYLRASTGARQIFLRIARPSESRKKPASCFLGFSTSLKAVWLVMSAICSPERQIYDLIPPLFRLRGGPYEKQRLDDVADGGGLLGNNEGLESACPNGAAPESAESSYSGRE
jgi:hypothetical protein